MIGLALFVLLLFVGVAWTTSLLTRGLARAGRRWLAQVEPAARARIWLSAALAPWAIGAAVVSGALVPREWLGEVNHCLEHVHMHLCALCGAPAPNLVAVTLLGVVLAWLAVGVTRAVRRAARGLRTLRRMDARADGDLRVMRDDRLQAFTSGLLTPRIYVSDAVAADPERWRAVLAHERAHVARRDPLVRIVARLATALHLPGTADLVLRELEEAQELAADESAAATVGDRALVAATLVDWVRGARSAPVASIAFEGASLERRVALLLDPPRYHRRPLASSPWAHAAAGALLAVASTSLHHSLEHLLELFAG